MLRRDVCTFPNQKDVARSLDRLRIIQIATTIDEMQICRLLANTFYIRAVILIALWPVANKTFGQLR